MTRSRIDSLIQMQEGLPEVTRQSLDKLQLEKLNRVLKREKERGGFYRDLPERLSSLEELSALPFTTEEDLARKAEELRLAEKKHGKVSFAIGYHAEQNAADIRAASSSRRKEKLRYETVRIVALLLGLHPADLQQRQRR